MAEKLNIHNEAARRDYFRLLFQALAAGSLTPSLLRFHLDSVVKGATALEFTAQDQDELTRYLALVVDMFHTGEIDLMAAIDDIDLLVLAAEADNLDLMQYVYIGPENFGGLPL